jgi:glycosyltransferase involved in cell wall biosynthesis
VLFRSVPEIVHDRETGLLVGENETEALPGKVRWLLGSDELRRKLGSAARKFVSENATTQTMVSKTRAVYDTLLRPLASAGAPEQSVVAAHGSDEAGEHADRRTGGTA